MEAPSAFNIQHSRFLAVTSRAARAALTEVAYGQPKVTESSATFIVLGDLEGHRLMPVIAARGAEAGLYDDAVAGVMVDKVNGTYEGNLQLIRDEAVRSASMAAMNLMTAATALGLVTGPMIGFDPEALRVRFNIAQRYIPVMLITVGYAAPGNWPRKPRLRPDEVLVANAEEGQVHSFSQ